MGQPRAKRTIVRNRLGYQKPKHGGTCRNHRPYLTKEQAAREMEAHRILLGPTCPKCQLGFPRVVFRHKSHWHFGHTRQGVVLLDEE